jgi:hypothetical protein
MVPGSVQPLAQSSRSLHTVSMARILRKSYAVSREPDGTYVINVREDLLPADVITGFLTLDRALDECARLNADEDKRRRGEQTSDA